MRGAVRGAQTNGGPDRNQGRLSDSRRGRGNTRRQPYCFEVGGVMGDGAPIGRVGEFWLLTGRGA